jgi:protein involved in polysaccharide export with SLBB domain
MGSKQVILADMWKLLYQGDIMQDPVLLAGDVVYVPRGGGAYNPKPFGRLADQRRPVRIWGAVKNPGLYELGAADDLLSAIGKAGGFQDNAKAKEIFLSRVDRDGAVKTERVSVAAALEDADAIGRVHVNPGDVVIVRQSAGKIVANNAGKAALATAVLSAAYYVFYRFQRKLNIQQAQLGRGIGGGLGGSILPSFQSGR